MSVLFLEQLKLHQQMQYCQLFILVNVIISSLSGFDKISDSQPCQLVKNYQHCRYHLCPIMRV